MPYLTKDAIDWALSELRALDLSKNDSDFATQFLYYRQKGMTTKNAIRTGDQSNESLRTWYDYFGAFGPEDCESFPEQKGISHLNPFQREARNSLQDKESLKKFLGGRLTENVLTWTGSKREILKISQLDVTPRAASIKCVRAWENAFLRDTLKGKEINIIAITIWINRFKKFPNVDLDSQVKILLKQINLVDSKIFSQTNPDSEIVLFSDDAATSKEIRDLFDWAEGDLEKIDELTNGQEPGIVPYLADYRQMKSFAEAMKINPELSKEDFLQLLEQSKQVILYGPPGTSKTYLKDLYLMDGSYDVRTIQFHQNYTYEQFISGYIFKNGKPTFQNGVLWNIIDECTENPEKKFVLFIDEINRGNVSKIMGECFNALDRGNKVRCLYTKEGEDFPVSKDLELPSNLYIIGTMNTVDLSLTKIDAALRRRFAFVPKYPELSVLESLTDDSSIREGIITQYMSYINSQIAKVFGPEGPLIGHAIFLPSGFRDDGKYIWETKQQLRLFHNYTIYPLLQAECESANADIGEILGILGQIYVDDNEYYAAICLTLYGEVDEQ